MNDREMALVDYYDSKPDYYSPLDHIDGPRLAALVDVTVIPPVLDLGCGNGRLGASVPKPVDGIDASAVRVERARATGRYRNLLVGSIYDTDMPQRYATVFAVELLEHLAAPTLAITAALGWLISGGSLIATVPIKMPNHAHLSVFASAQEAAKRLGADKWAEIRAGKNRHAVLRWTI